MEWLRRLGSPDPAAHAQIVLNYLDGVILQQMCLTDPSFDPTAGIRAVVTGLLSRYAR